jgi:hypothetical protein
MRKRKRRNFSKLVLACVMAAFFITMAAGIVYIFLPRYDSSDTAQALIGLYTFVGAPVGVAIAFYSWKAKHENVAKISKEDNGND